MKINRLLRNRGLIRFAFCRWGVVLVFSGYLALFVAELVELIHEPSAMNLMKVIGYGVLFGLVAFKSYIAIKNGKLFSFDNEANDELH